MELRDWLKKEGKSLYRLAKDLELNLPSLSLWARGKRAWPLRVALMIEDATNGQVTVRDLLPDYTPTPPVSTEEVAV